MNVEVVVKPSNCACGHGGWCHNFGFVFLVVFGWWWRFCAIVMMVVDLAVMYGGGSSEVLVLVVEHFDFYAFRFNMKEDRPSTKKGRNLLSFFSKIGRGLTKEVNLKNQIFYVLVRFKLQVQKMRSQSYDGANNMLCSWNGLHAMRCSWNGLHALFLKDCPYAYYAHCFAHRLQLTLVSAVKDVSIRNLQRAGDTHWSSHYSSVKSLIDVYAVTCKVLEYLSEYSPSTRSRFDVGGVYKTITTFEFVFILHLMHRILAIADVLYQALQKKTQNILTAMRFVCTTKTILQALRENGWKEFLEEVKCFCLKNDIHVPDFDGSYMVGRSHGREYPTIEHHYHCDIFNAANDFQMMELDTRFNETSIELLSLNMALDPKNSSESFNMDNLCKLAEKFYPEGFKQRDIYCLKVELQHYQNDVISKL
ncbi:uncharacterized protein LOC111406754 [Olea europaea var. sylvestris]|uniref:uncharacterized protein LOC111406754 n=1 Tax=Olea europaea var. sylvestris TaxID=158386 RepID=UPI000C1CD1C4|nr:uncharacterized protein LOC111406754 [Olea europaea var. sylvestris]